ncbi:carboxymuconolactone decarboxylase family protein (plasmid) [Marinobacter sp. M3C]|jgi:4-carboxymuconolactone decarboxylase|uniref:carboxymuconolactone decarboxylase family protein n=1 Tax=Marinobacter sp. M3C TaxID=2917715 RepID=UPI0020108AF5|nr:carboxymuconolactone decarboxylase family protein [Marinobacter sp. M3C]UQG62678.1 carboxymuconolactone decarboxylase family protein [Marinobacter sp. M3C]
MNDQLFEKGLKIRKEVLGEEHVERSLKNATEFSMDMQRLVTEYCWGEVWGRDGLSKKSRSMINLAMISVLNRPNELKTHVGGAINNGVTPDEIKEILLQVAIYAGVPAAIDAFRIADGVLAEKAGA